MSGTVEAAIITATGTIFAAIIGMLLTSKKRSQQKEFNNEGVLSNIGSISDSVINVNSPQIISQGAAAPEKETPQPSATPITDQLIEDLRKLQIKEGKPITDLTHKEICDAIEAAPPFHQDKIHDSFKGKHITWEAKLDKITHYKESTTIFAEMPSGVSLMCDSDLDNSEVFISAATGTNFIVTGKITKIGRHYVHLENCTYKTLKKGSPPVN